MGRYTYHIDWVTGILLVLIGAFGLFLLTTINPSLFYQQASFFLLGVVLLIAASWIDPIILWWAAPAAYVVSLLLLALSYLGPIIRGASRWVVVGGAQLQPSELVKPLFLLSFAYFLVRYPPRQLRNVPILLGLFFIPFFLVFKQPDLGTSIVYTSSFVMMLLAGGFSMWLLAAGTVILAFALPWLWHVLAPYQRTRIEIFLNPALDPRGAGYNALQAMIAVGSGQFFGRGLGRGTQSHLRFLPEHHTDFIFATLIEELGFLGGFILLLLYVLLLLRIVVPLFSAKEQDLRSHIYATGLFGMLLSQIFINAGMNMGLIPITGITLPFVSYGGSSILSTAVAFGLLSAMRREPAGASS